MIITTKFDHGLADGERVGLESLFPDGKTIYGHVNHALGGNDFALYADKALRTPAVLPGGAAITDTTTVFRVADEDHAIVVGIGAYPAIPCLEGPVKDALDFERWLRSSAGGCVPEANIALIRSPDFPPLPALADAKPTSEQVAGAFIELVAKALRNESAKYRVGRRLYIFMAGHGIAPTNADANETALLMANFQPAAPGLHVGTRDYAEWFRTTGAFDEVVLFVDCCRDPLGGVAARANPFPTLTPQRNGARRFYAMATKLHSKAWECSFDGEVRGIFSYSLMAALRNSGLCNEAGVLTGHVLANHLLSTVPKLMNDQEPAIEYDDIMFASRPVPKKPKARIVFGGKYIGKTASLLGRKYPEPDDTHVIGAEPWIVSLDRFHYIVKVEGANRPQSFEVDGTREVVDVSFD